MDDEIKIFHKYDSDAMIQRCLHCTKPECNNCVSDLPRRRNTAAMTREAEAAIPRVKELIEELRSGENVNMKMRNNIETLTLWLERLSDIELSKLCGISVRGVQARRLKFGIPAWPKRTENDDEV